MRKTCKYLYIVSLLLMMSCAGKQIQYTKVVEGCVSEKEMEILDTLFQNFVQKMNLHYACKDAEESLRFLAIDFEQVIDSGVVFISDNEEENLIEVYKSMPDFEKSWRIIKQLSYDSELDTLVYNNEYFMGVELFNCLESNSSDKELNRIFNSLKMAGDFSIYAFASAIGELTEPDKKISESLGFTIFSFCYVMELLNQYSLK